MNDVLVLMFHVKHEYLSNPLFPFEKEEQHDDDNQGKNHDNPKTVWMGLKGNIDVHSKQPGDESKGKQRRGNNGEYFHDFVGLVRLQ